jgi:hypothetical protein
MKKFVLVSLYQNLPKHNIDKLSHKNTQWLTIYYLFSENDIDNYFHPQPSIHETPEYRLNIRNFLAIE